MTRSATVWRWIVTFGVLAGLLLAARSEGMRLYAWMLRRAANRAYYAGDLQTSLARFERIRALLPGDPASYTDPADSICEALEWSPGSFVDPAEYQASAARAAGYYLDAIRVSAPNGWAYAGLGSLAGILGDARRRERGVDLSSFLREPLEALIPEDRLQEASLVRAVQLEPRNFYYRDFLGQFYWSRGFWDRARAHVRASVRLQPALHRHFYLSALVTVSPDLLVAVEEGVHDALQSGTTEVPPDQIHRMLAEVYLRRGEQAKARESFLSAASLSDSPHLMQVQIGRTYAAEGDDERALESFRLAAELEPEYYRSWMHLGLAWSRIGRRDEALQALRRARGLVPAEYQPAWLLAAELERGDEWVEAARILEQLTRRHPGKRETYLRLIDIYWSRQNIERAISVARRLVARFPGEAVFQEQLTQLEAARDG